MNLKYKHLSSGYVGKKIENATLNSQYYGLFFNELILSYNLNGMMAFPQRVPRSGFFTELTSLEEKIFKQRFNIIVSRIIKKYMDARTDLASYPASDNARKFINLAKILMRYGQFEVVIRNFLANYSGPYELEIKLLRESCIIENQLSNDESIYIDNLFLLSDKFIANPRTTTREKISLLNSIIVYSYRHQKKTKKNNGIIKHADLLRELLDTFERDNFLNKLYSSIAYRGLAMVSDFGEKHQGLLIEKAENIARNLKWSNEVEKVVASENLYTCLQSISKWHQHNNNFSLAANCFHEMIKLDSYDSTGYSELGFLYVEMDEIESARHNFKKAAELGPPGAGMNMYYYAKCLEKIGRKEEAIKHLHQSAELDEKAVTPWLDLLEYYSNTSGHKTTAIKIAKHMYVTPILREQLEEHEIKHIQNILN